MKYIKISLTKDGDSWCALIGDNLQTGIAGFGSNPATALLELVTDTRSKSRQFLPYLKEEKIKKPRITVKEIYDITFECPKCKRVFQITGGQYEGKKPLACSNSLCNFEAIANFSKMNCRPITGYKLRTLQSTWKEDKITFQCPVCKIWFPITKPQYEGKKFIKCVECEFIQVIDLANERRLGL